MYKVHDADVNDAKVLAEIYSSSWEMAYGIKGIFGFNYKNVNADVFIDEVVYNKDIRKN